MAARAAGPSFLQRRLEDVAWGDYDVVGFTSYCAQTAASLAMARLVKERHAGVRVVVGGPNWRGVMGRELHRRFPFIDLVVDGEADTSFPALVEWLGGRGGRTLGEISGVVYRKGGGRAPLRPPSRSWSWMRCPFRTIRTTSPR